MRLSLDEQIPPTGHDVIEPIEVMGRQRQLRKGLWVVETIPHGKSRVLQDQFRSTEMLIEQWGPVDRSQIQGGIEPFAGGHEHSNHVHST
jgi:hypothetical protein